MPDLDKQTEPLLLLKYFNLFRHPLNREELYRLCGESYGPSELTVELKKLQYEGEIQYQKGFYFLPGQADNIQKRLAGAAKADRLLPRAKQAGHFIALFPFVRFVGISGSLSKGYADEKTDFDFFIITAANTLWICRSLLHLFKKFTFLINRQHHFCMNYFIDETHLSLEEQNLFTQIELSTLIPVHNRKIYSLFLYRNQDNLPNLHRLPYYKEADALEQDQKVQKQNKWATSLNSLLMRITDFKWKRKWEKKNYPMEDYALAFKTTPYVSKNHPKNYQKTILNRLRIQEETVVFSATAPTGNQ